MFTGVILGCDFLSFGISSGKKRLPSSESVPEVNVLIILPKVWMKDIGNPWCNLALAVIVGESKKA